MENIQRQIGDILINSDLFTSSNRKDIIRLLPFVEVKSFQKGETIYRTGDQANSIFLIKSGKIELKSDRRSMKILEAGSFGEESIRKKSRYLLNAITLEDAEIICIPIENLDSIIKGSRHFKDIAYGFLINHFSPEKMAKIVRVKRSGKDDVPTSQLIGWLVTVAVPLIIFLNLRHFNLTWEQGIFITVASATVLMWIFRLANEFIPSLLAIIVIIILQIAPPKVALSGFNNDSFFMAMSIFGISYVLVSSGLTFRLVVNLLNLFPMSQYWHARTLLFTGIIMTPFLPSANGRIVLAVPILNDMIESLGYEKKGKAANLLASATYMGFTFFSTAFLSSKTIHFVIYGLFPTQIQEQFTWLYWFYASIPSFLFMLVLFMITLKVVFRENEPPRLSREIIAVQKEILGPMTQKEWAALGGILLFGIGIATSGLHKIEMTWVGLIVLYVVLVSGVLSKSDFQSHVDWTFLLYQAALIGLVKTISFTGIDGMLGEHLQWIGVYIKSNIYLFVLILSGVIFVMRIFIPNNATVVILATFLFPIAEISGLNAWIVAFIILMMSDAAFFPYQTTYYVLFQDMMKKKNLVNLNYVIGINAFSVIFRIAAIYVSIPFWRMIGIL